MLYTLTITSGETSPMSHHLAWNKDFELGVKDIDFQHQYFVDLINRLQVDLRLVSEPKQVSYLIAELNAYARFHFISEENLMRKAGYPALESHKNLHFELIDSLTSKEAKLHAAYSDNAIDQIIDFLINWFKNHTINEDKLFADFLRGDR
jgi:hemerythrin